MNALSLYDLEYETWNQTAAEYDTLFAPVSAQVIDDVLNSLGEVRGRRHLDVACGTGQLVAAAAARGAISEGLDFSPMMIKVARQSFPASSFYQSDARRIPFEDQRFRLVTCTFGLSHMEEPLEVMKEIFRVMEPGGTFTFALWFGPEDGNELMALIKSAVSLYVESTQKLPESWTSLRYADKQRCRQFLLEAGFDNPDFKDVPVMIHDPGPQEIINIIEKLTIRTKHVLNEQPHEMRQDIMREIGHLISEKQSGNGINLKFPALLITAQKPSIEE